MANTISKKGSGVLAVDPRNEEADDTERTSI